MLRNRYFSYGQREYYGTNETLRLLHQCLKIDPLSKRALAHKVHRLLDKTIQQFWLVGQVLAEIRDRKRSCPDRIVHTWPLISNTFPDNSYELVAHRERPIEGLQSNEANHRFISALALVARPI